MAEQIAVIEPNVDQASICCVREKHEAKQATDERKHEDGQTKGTALSQGVTPKEKAITGQDRPTKKDEGETDEH